LESQEGFGRLPTKGLGLIREEGTNLGNLAWLNPKEVIKVIGLKTKVLGLGLRRVQLIGGLGYSHLSLWRPLFAGALGELGLFGGFYFGLGGFSQGWVGKFPQKRRYYSLGRGLQTKRCYSQKERAIGKGGVFPKAWG